MCLAAKIWISARQIWRSHRDRQSSIHGVPRFR